MGDPTRSDVMQKLRVLTEDLPQRDIDAELHFINCVLDQALQFCPQHKVVSNPDELANWFSSRRNVYYIQTVDGVKIVTVPGE